MAHNLLQPEEFDKSA